MKKPNLHKAISFTNAFYIFDCLDAELRKENVPRTKSSFLDINNGIKKKKNFQLSSMINAVLFHWKQSLYLS